MKKAIALLATLVLLVTLVGCAMAEIIASPNMVEFSNGVQVHFYTIVLEKGTVQLVLAGDDNRMILKNNKYILAYQANITVNGKTVKSNKVDTLGHFFMYTYKAKKLPESIIVIKKGVLDQKDETKTMVITDTDALPEGKSAVIDQFVVQMITVKEAFKAKGNLTSAQADTHVGNDIMRKGSNVPRSMFQNSQEGKSMLLVPLKVNMAYSDAADSPTQILLGAKMADGTSLYDLWYDDSICILLFDTQAYADKELTVAVKDGVLTFDAMP